MDVILIILNISTLSALLALGFKAYHLNKSLSSTKESLKTLELKYRLNPDYDSQQIMAEMLTGGGLFKVEKIESENLFYLRK